MEKKNICPQQKKLPHRVKLLLDSKDIDLVQIGANMMKEYIPKNKWEKVLQMFSIDEEYDHIFIPKWEWEIKGNEIIIKARSFLLDSFTVNLWALKEKTEMPLLTMTLPSSTIQYIHSDKYTFQIPTNGK